MDQVPSKKYDLVERTTVFGRNIIQLCKSSKVNIVSDPLIRQLVRSGTSIGANYMEATCASSKKDFRNKVFIAKKESQESKYWLVMLSTALPEIKPAIDPLWQECHELNLILQKITSSLKI